MFDHPGEKIKTIAKVWFWIQGAGSTLLLFVSLLLATRGWRDVEEVVISFLLFIIAVVLSWVFAWLTCIFVYGFGQLIDDTEKNKEINLAMLQISKNRL